MSQDIDNVWESLQRRDLQQELALVVSNSSLLSDSSDSVGRRASQIPQRERCDTDEQRQKQRRKQWRVAGFGHCSSWFLSMKHVSLRHCLRRCEAMGLHRCRFMSYLDADILTSGTRNKDSSNGLCRFTLHCPALRATTLGVVTYWLRSQQRQYAPQLRGWIDAVNVGPDFENEYFSLGLTKSFASKSSWNWQLCGSRNWKSSLQNWKSRRQISLEKSCELPSLGLFRFSSIEKNESLRSHAVVIEAMDGSTLCGDEGRLHLAKICNLSKWRVLYRLPREEELAKEKFSKAGLPYSGSALTDVFGEASVRLLLVEADAEPRYLVALDQNSIGLVSEAHVSQGQPQWAIGFRQPWHWEYMSHHKQDVEIGSKLDPCQASTHVWATCSETYRPFLDHFLKSHRLAGDPVNVHIRWLPDYKDVHNGGFKSIWGRSTWGAFLLAHLQKKHLVLFEAMLFDALAIESSVAPPLVVFMDVDVQVFPGWVNSFQECLLGAHVCFAQQSGFHRIRFQTANAGAIAMRGDSAAVLAFNHAMMSLIHAYEFEVRLDRTEMTTGQLIMNQVLMLVNLERVSRRLNSTLRWGIFNPSIAYTNPCAPIAPLLLRVHHATSSREVHKGKMYSLTRVQKYVYKARRFCEGNLTDGQMNAGAFRSQLTLIGPQLFSCTFMRQEDPYNHIFLIPFKVFEGFAAEDVNHVGCFQGFIPATGPIWQVGHTPNYLGVEIVRSLCFYGAPDNINEQIKLRFKHRKINS